MSNSRDSDEIDEPREALVAQVHQYTMLVYQYTMWITAVGIPFVLFCAPGFVVRNMLFKIIMSILNFVYYFALVGGALTSRDVRLSLWSLLALAGAMIGYKYL